MIICIAGGREFKPNNRDELWLIRILAEFKVKNRELLVIEGGAKGADAFGRKIAENLNISVKTFKANWNKYGKIAGFKRNTEMIDIADILIVFPGGNGTNDTISKAKKKGINIITRYR